MGSGQLLLWVTTLCLTVLEISLELTHCTLCVQQAESVTTAQLTSSNSLSLCNSITAIIFPVLTGPNIFPL